MTVHAGFCLPSLCCHVLLREHLLTRGGEKCRFFSLPLDIKEMRGGEKVWKEEGQLSITPEKSSSEYHPSSQSALQSLHPFRQHPHDTEPRLGWNVATALPRIATLSCDWRRARQGIPESQGLFPLQLDTCSWCVPADSARGGSG